MILKTKFWIAILALTVLLCLGLTLVTMGGEEASRAKITSDGKLIRIVDLSVDQEFTVQTEGGYNVVTVKDGKIAVTAATCPDGHCMNRGFCHNGLPIVCLPNGVVITVVGEDENQPDIIA